MRKFLLGILLMPFLVSCDSILDLEPKNGVTFDHYFETEADLEALMVQMHGSLRDALAVVNYQDHIGLNVDVVRTGTDHIIKLRQLNAEYMLMSSNQQQWKPYYNVLALVDLFFDNYQKVKNISSDRVKFYRGQGEFIRSVCYFYLARTWGDAVITKGSKYTDKYAKSPAEIVLDTAINAALRAYDLLPKYANMKNSNNKALTSKQYGCKGSVAALLAHLYAWKGSVFNNADDLKKSESWADKLIETKYQDEVGVYELAANAEEVCTKVMDRKSAESIFEIEINYKDASSFATFLPGTYLIGAPVMKGETREEIKDKVYGVYITTIESMYPKGDGRRSAYFYNLDDPEWRESGRGYLYKWRTTRYGASMAGEAWFIGMDVNKVIFRLADIYLLRAECRVKLNEISGAESDLNKIRQRANANAWPANGETDLQYAIFKEREKELLYEGNRYYDVVRNGYWNTEFGKDFPKLSASDVEDGALYLPVPEAAFYQNDLMFQNSYWASKMK